MARVIPITGHQVFSIDEAQILLPVILKFTQKTHLKLKELISIRDRLRRAGIDSAEEHEQKIRAVIDYWEAKIIKLGGRPKGLWLVDFDNGSGYFCWKFPEPRIIFQHGYEEGFTGRRAIIADIASNQKLGSINQIAFNQPKF